MTDPPDPDPPDPDPPDPPDTPDPLDGTPHVIVPWEQLSEQALLGVIDEFVTREGTEYGATEVSLDAKRARVQAQLEKGDVLVLFDTETSTANLVTRRKLEKQFPGLL